MTPDARPRRAVSRWLVAALSGPVVAYRRWLSPAIPPRCRFHPSCSAYTLEALQVHGAFRGLALSVWRILRCQPFHPGGYDPVPPPAASTRRDRTNRLLSGASRWTGI